LISALISLGEIPNLRVLFNKYDPQYRHQHDAVVKHVTLRIQEMFEKEFNLPVKEVYKTSVFEIPSLITAFSALFRDISPISYVIASIYQYFAGLSSAYAGFVFTDNGFVISEWTKRLTEERRNRIFDEAYNFIRKNAGKEEFETKIVKTVYQGVFFVIEKIDVEGAIIYLASVNTKDEAIGVQNLKLLRDQVRPWIKNFFAIGNKRRLNLKYG
jgi:hypothetical protein